MVWEVLLAASVWVSVDTPTVRLDIAGLDMGGGQPALDTRRNKLGPVVTLETERSAALDEELTQEANDIARGDMPSTVDRQAPAGKLNPAPSTPLTASPRRFGPA